MKLERYGIDQMNRRSMALDYSDVKTYDANTRKNLVRIDTLKRPVSMKFPYGAMKILMNLSVVFKKQSAMVARR